MKLVITCIWISLFTLVGINQFGYATEQSEPQRKETIALIGTGDFGNSFGPRLAALGYPVVAINPNDTDIKSEDNLKGMKKRAKEEGFTFPYLKDATQEVYRTYGATRTPHIYVLTKDQGDYVVSYIGAIDDNYQDASAVKEPYLANALDALLAGSKPDPSSTKAIGCSIKTKK